MLYLGIDPGVSGAASLIKSNGQPPLTTTIKLEHIKFKDATEHEIAEWFRDVADTDSIVPSVKAVIERVHSMPKQGVASSFKFGQSYGFLRGLLCGLSIEFYEVTPQQWQKDMKCLTRGDKNVSKAAAHRLWPRYTNQITHANADSLLLARWLCQKENTI